MFMPKDNFKYLFCSWVVTNFLLPCLSSKIANKMYFSLIPVPILWQKDKKLAKYLNQEKVGVNGAINLTQGNIS